MKIQLTIGGINEDSENTAIELAITDDDKTIKVSIGYQDIEIPLSELQKAIKYLGEVQNNEKI